MRDYMINKLLELGCERDGDTFTKTMTVTQPGTQLIINGQQVHQPPQQIDITSSVELLEDGYVENADGSNHETIYWINIKVKQGNETAIDQMEGLYSGEQNIFDSICSQIFKNS